MKILVLGLSLFPFPVGGFPFSLALQGPIQLQLALSVIFFVGLPLSRQPRLRLFTQEQQGAEWSGVGPLFFLSKEPDHLTGY